MVGTDKMAIASCGWRFMRLSLKNLLKWIKILLTESEVGVIILVYCIGMPCRLPTNFFLNKNP